jgi:hypothetical protein
LGYISKEEVGLLLDDVLTNLAAFEMAQRMRFTGTEQTADVEQFKKDWVARGRDLADKFERWYEPTQSRLGERFASEASLTRAAALWQLFHVHIPHGRGALDACVDLYLLDYIMCNASTLTWDIGIKPATVDQITFARTWGTATHARHAGPFVDRDFNDPTQVIFTAADILTLAALRPVAASNIDQIACPPKDGKQELALHFYGGVVGDHGFDDFVGQGPYVGLPIFTKNWSLAVSQLYLGGVMPALPRTYLFPRIPTIQADDVMRGMARYDYDVLYGCIKNGGAMAHNAITVQAMHCLHDILSAPAFDVKRSNRCQMLMNRWVLEAVDRTVEITGENAMISAERLQQLVAAVRKDDRRMRSEIEDLPARHHRSYRAAPGHRKPPMLERRCHGRYSPLSVRRAPCQRSPLAMGAPRSDGRASTIRGQPHHARRKSAILFAVASGRQPAARPDMPARTTTVYTTRCVSPGGQ